MSFTERSRARLYAITAVACAIWLVQSLIEAYHTGTIWDWSTIVFSLCLLLVTVYTAWCAVQGWNASDDDQATNERDDSSYDRAVGDANDRHDDDTAGNASSDSITS